MIKIIDERFKDASPIDTVKKLKSILSGLGIETKEKWNESGMNNCHSFRVTINNSRIGSNGKGITKELATASGYAELLERIQSGMIGANGEMDFSLGKSEPVYGDSVYLNKEQLVEKCDYYLDTVSKAASEFENIAVSKENLADACFSLERGADVTEAVPFYDVIEGKQALIPVRLNCLTSGSNGLAAGNTMEEAVIEGFSEIVERYAQNRILKEKIVPPTIPDEYLRNFEIAYKIITDIKNAGYDVLIKDCSLGEGYPVIATVIIDKKHHTYHAHVGSSPVFEIALQRSMTEMFQGRQIESVAKVHEVSLNQSDKLSLSNVMTAFHFGIGEYPIEYFDGTPSYPFVPFEDNRNSNNKELLAGVVEYVRKKGRKLLVRDLSHFGFNTYRVIVPGMSEWKYYYFSSNLPVLKLNADTYGVINDLKKASADSLFSLQVLNRYRLKSKMVNCTFSSLSEIPLGADAATDSFLGAISMAYIEWECGDRQAACKYAKSVLAYADENSAPIISCLCKLPDLYNKENIDINLTRLSRFYEEDVIDSLREVFERGVNPFSPFIISCNTDNCGTCKYKDTCDLNENRRLYEMIHKATLSFDNEKAFNAINEGFLGIKAVK